MYAELKEKGVLARKAARRLATLDSNTKNAALEAIAEAILESEETVIGKVDGDQIENDGKASTEDAQPIVPASPPARARWRKPGGCPRRPGSSHRWESQAP